MHTIKHFKYTCPRVLSYKSLCDRNFIVLFFMFRYFVYLIFISFVLLLFFVNYLFNNLLII